MYSCKQVTLISVYFWFCYIKLCKIDRSCLNFVQHTCKFLQDVNPLTLSTLLELSD